MYDSYQDARQLPTKHLTIRVPWHDAAWDGTVCRNPRGNASCTVLKRIGLAKDDAKEQELAGSQFDQIDEAELPPCAAERGAILSPWPYRRTVNHPYVEFSELHCDFEPTPVTHPPYSAAGIPFAWLLKKSLWPEEGTDGLVEQYGLDAIRQEDEPTGEQMRMKDPNWIQTRHNHLVVMDTFFSAAKPEKSLVFFYAKRTPLSERPDRVIVGVGVVKDIAPAQEYRYRKTAEEMPIRALIWDRPITHSIRPGFEDGFLLPYQELLAKFESASYDFLEPFVAFAPSDHFDSYSYATEHLSHAGAIASLLSVVSAIENLRTEVEGPWDHIISWIEGHLDRLWKMQGAFPSFAGALQTIGVPSATLVANEFERRLREDSPTKTVDPWSAFEEIINESEDRTELSELIGRQPRKVWKSMPAERQALLKLLSRFDLSLDLYHRYADPGNRSKYTGSFISDREVLENPYRVFEIDEYNYDRVGFTSIDRGLLPSRDLAGQFPVPEPSKLESSIDPRRLRAMVIDVLRRAADQGHTALPEGMLFERLQAYETAGNLSITNDIFNAAKPTFDPLVTVIEAKDGSPAFALKRYAVAEALIRTTVAKRTKETVKRHRADHDWEAIVDGVLSGPATSCVEQDARSEKAIALEAIYSSRFSVLIGRAGTGKTTLVKALLSLSDVDPDSVLLLAPTGKARVRLQTATGHEAQTVAQFLNRRKRFDIGTASYRILGDVHRESGYKTVIVDESSMLTSEELAATLDSFSGVARIVLVGDTRQLPPIGPGRPFFDVAAYLEGKPERAELRIQRRHKEEENVSEGQDEVPWSLKLANWFAVGEDSVLDDEVWQKLESGDKLDTITTIGWDHPEDLRAKLDASLRSTLELSADSLEVDFGASYGGNPSGNNVYFNAARPDDESGIVVDAEKWQILSPYRSRDVGSDALNRWIKQTYRSRAMERAQNKDIPFYKRKTMGPIGSEELIYGDKVIGVKNHWIRFSRPHAQGEQFFVANGDIGVIVGETRFGQYNRNNKLNKIEIQYTNYKDRRLLYLPGEFGDEEDPPVALAYALTVHKTQGSEFTVTFVVLPNPSAMLSSELLYTALTRQTTKIVILHQGPLHELRKYSRPEYSETFRRFSGTFKSSKPITVSVDEERAPRYLDKNLIHRTERGELVRSKSEVIIANMLHSRGMSYKYEEQFQGTHGYRLPDFTIHDDDTGELILIEHLGLLGFEPYRRSWERKLEWYRRNGVDLAENNGGERATLLVTEDGPNGEIDSQKLAEALDDLVG